MSNSPTGKEVPFEFFIELVQAMAAIEPKPADYKQHPSKASPSPAVRVFTNWVSGLQQRYGPVNKQTAATVFRLLFPGEDASRKYGMQETRLARYLAKIFAVCVEEGGRGQGLLQWCSDRQGKGSLGVEIEKVVQAVCTTDNRSSSVTINEVDMMLAELASTCPFSSLPARQEQSAVLTLPTPHRTPRKAYDVLRDIFMHSSLSYSHVYPAACSVLVQVILKDLRPILYPLPTDAEHYSRALLGYKSNAVRMLTIHQALYVWDPSGALLESWKLRGWSAFQEDIEFKCTDIQMQEPQDEADVDDPEERADKQSIMFGSRTVTPVVGLPVSIPKCIKGTSCVQALRSITRHNSETGSIWAETKYDGERAQIHVQRLSPQNLAESRKQWKITIYSKSGRDSTWDRAAIHEIVFEALGISSPDGVDATVKHSAILEAEMVAYSEEFGRVDEFWRIRSLIASTAIGPRYRPSCSRRKDQQLDAQDTEGQQLDTQDTEDTDENTNWESTWSQGSLISDGSDGGARRLALVFFDLLVLDGVSLLEEPYQTRRAMLERIIRTRTGYAMLAERVRIPSPMPSRSGVDDDATSALRSVMAANIAAHEEGVVLKAGESSYNDWRMPWVKLKKDYILGYGDCMDLILLGAGWNKDRAREVRVGPAAYTTFYIGALANLQKPENPGNSSLSKPRFEILFTAEYGLSREALEELNFLLKNSDHVDYRKASSRSVLPYTFDIYSGIARPGPAILLETPLLVEVMGAGFTKEPQSKHYSLRFPRILKYYRRSERAWPDGISLNEMQSIARTSVGRDRPGKAEDDWVKSTFGNIPSPSIRAEEKKEEREQLWVGNLERADGVTRKRMFDWGDSREGAARRVNTRKDARQARFKLTDEGKGDRDENGARVVQAVLRSPSPLKALAPVTNFEKAPMSPSPTAIQRSSPALEPILAFERAPSNGDLSASEDLLKQCSLSACLKSVQMNVKVGCTDVLLATENAAQEVSSVTAALTPAGNFPRPAVGLRYAQTALGKLLARSAVWLAYNVEARSTWCVSLREIIPTGHRVHDLDALLIACGWETRPPRHPLSYALLPTPICTLAWAECGIVFVDDSDSGHPPEYWTDPRFPLRKLMEARTWTINSKMNAGSERGCIRPIWVLGMRMLSAEHLDRECTGEVDDDLAARAICKFG